MTPPGRGELRTRRGDRFSWRSGGKDLGENPAYWVSGADWLTLVEAFDLAADLEDKARR